MPDVSLYIHICHGNLSLVEPALIIPVSSPKSLRLSDASSSANEAAARPKTRVSARKRAISLFKTLVFYT